MSSTGKMGESRGRDCSSFRGFNYLPLWNITVLCCRSIGQAHGSPFDTTGVIGPTYTLFVVAMSALWALFRARSASEIDLTAFTRSTNLGLFQVRGNHLTNLFVEKRYVT